jgi:cysteine desulfurase/selenocysteine lyase
MIDRVELQSSTYAYPPSRFEPGTPAIAEAVGLGAACKYLSSIGMQRIFEHETALGNYLYDQLDSVPNLSLYGPKSSTGRRTGLVAFNSFDVHATDLSFFLDQEGVAVRTGHHCTQPLHALLGAAGR